MATATRLVYSTVLSMLTCGECSIPFAIPTDLHDKVKQTGQRFYCPNGHHIAYGESENARLQRRLKSAEASATHHRDQREAAERSARAYKGQVTKIKRRVGNGVCPCCKRTFADLGRHMAGQHPDFADT